MRDNCVLSSAYIQHTIHTLSQKYNLNIVTMPVTAGAVATVYTCFCAYTYIYSVWHINQSVGLYFVCGDVVYFWDSVQCAYSTYRINILLG